VCPPELIGLRPAMMMGGSVLGDQPIPSHLDRMTGPVRAGGCRIGVA
jgi:hypothetical protein